MKCSSITLAFCCLASLSAVVGERPANSDVAVDDAFDRDELGDGWVVNKGRWRIVDGVLRGSEIAAERHAAAARRVVQTENAVYQLRFRFVGDGKALHVGFDPARGELDKKGHLFSVVVTPDSWKVLKHADKNRPEEAPNETLAEHETEFLPGQWHTLRVTTWGRHVTARVEGKTPLKASDASFDVKKPTLVFRCLGDGVEIDDLHVWTQRTN